MTTTYYARNVTDNWATDSSSWSLTGSGGAATAAHPVAGDTAIFDSGFTGNITIAAAAACATLTVQAGATGTLTWGTFSLTVTAGVTFVSGFHLSGSTGTLTLTAAQTLTMGGLTLPGNMTISASGTTTLGGALIVTGTLVLSVPVTFAGAFDITCGTLTHQAGSNAIKLVSGQTLTVVTAINIVSSGFGTPIIQSTTTSSAAMLIYQGAAGACHVGGANFTDIDATGSTPDTLLDNWYGGTLTRCKNAVFTVSAANATVGATYTHNGQTYTVDATISGGTTLNCTIQTKAMPLASGTLTKSGGTGDSTITFSAVALAGINNITSADVARNADKTKILTGQTVGTVAGSASAGGGGSLFGGVVVR